MTRMIDRLEDSKFVPPQWTKPQVSVQLEGKSDDEIRQMIAVMPKGYPAKAKAELDRWFESVDFKQGILKAVSANPIIVADNLVQWCFENLGDKDDSFGVFDCPNAAPPFKDFWIESRLPSKMKWRDAKTGQWHEREDKIFHAIGCHFHAIVIGEEKGDALYAEGQEYLAPLAEAHPSAHWLLWGALLIERNKGDMFAIYRFALAIGKEGQVLGETEFSEKQDRENADLNLLNFCLGFLLTAIAFMHCKNVSMVQSETDVKLNKARMKRGRRPLLRYHTLAIDSMKRTLATEGGSGTNGVKQSLHICRGHFKRFDDKPLFGKHKGLYWWDQQVRGKSDQGVVAKDYSLKPSTGDTEKTTPPDRAWNQLGGMISEERAHTTHSG